MELIGTPPCPRAAFDITQSQSKAETITGTSIHSRSLSKETPRSFSAPAGRSTAAVSPGKMAVAYGSARSRRTGERVTISLKVNGSRDRCRRRPIHFAQHAAQRSRAERCQIWLRARPVRRLHGVARRPGGALVRHRDRYHRRGRDHHDRGAWHRRQAASAAAGLHRPASRTVWLLHQINGMIMTAKDLLDHNPHPTLN